MSKENIRKHASMRNGLPGIQRRDSRDETKEQIVDQKMSCTTQQTEVMKKIQNKLRLRKRSTNVNGNQRLVNTPPDLSSTGNLSQQHGSQISMGKNLQAYDMSIDIPETVNRILDRDQNIIDKMILANANRELIKQQLLKDTTFILCQLNKGRKIEQILSERVSSIIESNKLKQRIQQKQKSIMAMMDERIKKLIMLQKPLVH